MQKRFVPLLRLKFLAIEKFGSQFELARRLDVREDTFSRIVRGRHPLTEELTVKLEKLLGCERTEFLPENSEMRRVAP